MDNPVIQDNPPVARARRLLRKTGENLPKCWRVVDELREQLRGPEKDTTWPDWCYLPTSVAQSAMDVSASNRRMMREGIDVTPELFSCMGGWRVTKGVYVFDEDVLADLATTPITDTLPAKALYQLPEWTVFLENQDNVLATDSWVGIFVQLDYTKDMDTLRLMLLGPEDRFEFIEVPIAYQTMASVIEEITQHPAGKHVHALALVNAILFLCLETEQVRNNCPLSNPTPRHPRPFRTKKHGWRMFAVRKPTHWLAGQKTGKRLRLAGIAQSSASPTRKVALGANPVPAHWCMPGTPGNPGRAALPRWVPTLPKGVDSPDNLQAMPGPMM